MKKEKEEPSDAENKIKSISDYENMNIKEVDFISFKNVASADNLKKIENSANLQNSNSFKSITNSEKIRYYLFSF